MRLPDESTHGPPAGIRYYVFLLYALSGFISLGYQVAWFRILVDWFGSTSLTFALVVSGFIGGLGIGALLSGTICRWLAARAGVRDGLRLYGLVEILVGLTALFTPLVAYLPANILGSFPFRLSDGVWVQTIPYEVVQVLAALFCVFVPCLFMGVTFPLLCDTFRRSDTPSAAADRLPSSLYAWNTLGACVGILACQFALLPWFGHGVVFWLMAALNLALGSFFLVRGGTTGAAPIAAVARTLGTVQPALAQQAAPGFTNPVDGQAVSGDVVIRGTAVIDTFQKYELHFKQEPSGDEAFIYFLHQNLSSVKNRELSLFYTISVPGFDGITI